MAAKKKAARRPNTGAAVLSLEHARQKRELSLRTDDLGERFSRAIEFTYEMREFLRALGFSDRYLSLATRDLLTDWLNGAEVPSWRAKK
jgi:hypothetical protein